MNILLEDNLENITETDWDALVLQSSTKTIFQRYRWHKAWIDAFKDEIEKVYIISVFEEGNLKGVAPMMIVRKKNKKILKFIAAGRADYQDFIYVHDQENVLSKIIDFIAEHQDQWDEVILENIPEYSTTIKNLDHFCRVKKLKCLNFSKIACPTLMLRKDKDTLQKILNKKSLIRHQKYFLKKEGYEVLHVSSHKEITQFLDQFFQQHIERRAVTEVASLFLDERNRAFYKNLSLQLSAKKWGVLSVIKSEGQPIAFHFGFIYNKKFVWYKPSFDIDLFKLYPGEALLKELMEYAVVQGCEEFDFALGMESFKKRFSNEVRENFSYKVFKSSQEFWVYKIFSPLTRLKVTQKIRKFLGKLRKACGPEGGGLIAPLMTRLFRYNCVYLYTIEPHHQVSKDVKSDLGDFQIREIGIKDLCKLEFFTSPEHKQNFLAKAFERIKQGDQCFAGEHQNTIVAIAWGTYQREIVVSEVETKILNTENALLIFDCITIPEYRGKHVYPYLLKNLIELHLNQKKMIYCEEKNTTSRKGIEKNFRLVKKLYLLKILGLKLRWSRSEVF